MDVVAGSGADAPGSGSETSDGEIFAEELGGFARRYAWEFRAAPDSRDLCVFFSPTAKRFAFHGQTWPTNVLFLSDRDDFYYIIGAGRSADLLCKAIDRCGFENVLFIGSSKAGFGAILWSVLCARRRPDRMFRSLAFSAQTRLFPFNDTLDFPSYRKAWKRAEADPRVMAALVAYGDLRPLMKPRNALITLVYGERNEVDRREASRLFAPNIRKYPVPLRFHGSMIPFTVRHLRGEDLRKWLDNLYARAAGEEDLRKILPKDPADLVAEFDAMQWIPDLHSFVAESLRLGAPKPSLAPD